MVKRLWREYMSRYKLQLAAAFVMMILLAGANAAFPLSTQWIFTKLGQGDAVDADPGMVMVYGPVILLALGFTMSATQYAYSMLSQFAALSTLRDMQNDMFESFLHFDFAQTQDEGAGQLVSRFTNDTTILRESLIRAPNAIRDIIQLIGLLGVMIWFDWMLFLVVLLVYPTVGLPVTILGKYLRRVSKRVQSQIGDMTSQLTESMRGARMVKSYNLENYEQERARQSFEHRHNLLMKGVAYSAANNPVTTTVGTVAVAIVVVLAAWRIQNGELNAPDLIGFIVTLTLLSAPARSLGTLNAVLQQGFASLERLFWVIDMKPEIADRPDATGLIVPKEAGGAEITFEDVSFSYEGEGPALQDFSLHVPAGKTVAIVGESGSGKTTLLNLLIRLYECDKGRILINGQDINDVTLVSLREHIALVSQEAVLFDDTVDANIRFGQQDATAAQIENAAQAAAADEFIREQAHHYDTMVGDSGSNFSGGQRQRIALARAFLKDAPILLLDEATSALDAESESKVQAALATLSAGRTTLVIAHRLSTVRNADLICVMDRGRIIEQGRHEDLLGEAGVYARLAALQFSNK